MNDLQNHLQAQRISAMRLIEQHNLILASAINRGDCSTVVSAPVVPESVVSNAVSQSVPQPVSLDAPLVVDNQAPRKGNVISLFDYKSGTVDLAEESPDSEAGLTEYASGCVVFHENDAAAREQYGNTVDKLLEVYGGDDALAINRKQMAGMIFLTSTKDAIFYHKSADGVMFVTSYVGPEDKYIDALNEIKTNAEENNLIINIMAQDNRVEALQACGLSTTPIGIWQRVEPLENFTLAGSKMRRLRYLVGKYKKLGDCKTIEYMPGTTKEVDEDICQVMDQWVELKEASPPFVAQVQKQIMNGELGSDHRFFLTYRDEKLDNVIVLSRDNLNDGYLMDLEFYAKDMPLGSTEFALSEIIACFQKENRKVLSLGLTMGTGLFEHDNRSQHVHDLFATLKKAEYLDGDANAQYKNKYRPTTVSMYIARPNDCGSKKLNDLMMILGTG